MSDTAAAIIGSIVSFQLAAIFYLAYTMSKLRERISQIEGRFVERNHKGEA